MNKRDSAYNSYKQYINHPNSKGDLCYQLIVDLAKFVLNLDTIHTTGIMPFGKYAGRKIQEIPSEYWDTLALKEALSKEQNAWIKNIVDSLCNKEEIYISVYDFIKRYPIGNVNSIMRICREHQVFADANAKRIGKTWYVKPLSTLQYLSRKSNSIGYHAKQHLKAIENNNG